MGKKPPSPPGLENNSASVNIEDKKKPWIPTNKRFICFLDIMGFKDMVMRESHAEIYELLVQLSNHRSSLENPNLPTKYDSDSLKTVSFSDSIIIFTKDDSIECLELLSVSSSWLFAKAMESGIPLKGAISLGEMSTNITKQIFFGQPLIDAYLLEEDVAFYGIVIHNTVEKFLNNSKSSLFEKIYFDCLIPLKSGKINHLILDWFSALEDEKENIDIKEVLLKIMRKQREKTSGGPRKYIDNTIDVINQVFNQKS